MRVLGHVSRALNHALIVCVLVVLITFFLVRIVPGDPVVSIEGLQSTPQARAAMRQELHLNRPFPVALALYVRDLATGNLGTSLVQQSRPVGAIIGSSLPVSLSLIATSILIATLLGVPLGLCAALGGKWIDVTVRGFATLFLALPPFFLGLILLLVVGLDARFLPPGGWGHSPQSDLRFLVLPSLALAGFLTPLIARVARQSTRQNLSEPWVEAAIVRGLSRTRLTLAHLLPNAVLPVITLVGYNVGALITGAVVVESVFALPGIGQALFNAINSRDYPVIQGIALISALAVVAANLSADLISSLVDPRTRRT